MGERIADFILRHTPREVCDYLLQFRDLSHEEYIMDNRDVIAFHGLEYRDTCLFSMFVTETGVDTSEVSSVAVTLVRQVNNRRYFFLKQTAEETYNFHYDLRGEYDELGRIVQNQGLQALLRIGRYHQRETLEMIRNALQRLWFYGHLRQYTLTEEDVIALRVITQASAVYSFEPIDFMSLVIAGNNIQVADEIRPSVLSLKGYSQRIQRANGLEVDSTANISRERRFILSQPREIYSWYYAMEDGFFPEEVDFPRFIHTRPDLLAQLIVSGTLILENMFEEEIIAMQTAWRERVPGAHLLSPKLLFMNGFDLSQVNVEEYNQSIDSNDKYIEAHALVSKMRDLPHYREDVDDVYEPKIGD